MKWVVYDYLLMGSALSKLASGFRQAGSFLSRCITNSRLYRSARDTFSRRSRAVDVEHGASNEPHSQQNDQIAFVTLPPVGPLHELANNLVGLNDPHNFDEGEESPTEDEGINSDLALTASSDDEWEDNVATNPDLPAPLPPQLDTGTRGLANPDGIVSRHHIFSPRPDESERNRKRNRGRSRQETYVRRRPYWCTSYEWKIPHIEGKLCSGNTSDDIEEDLESFPAFLKPYLNRPVVVYLREAHHKRNKALSNMSKEYNHLIRNVHYLRVYFRHHPMMSGVQKVGETVSFSIQPDTIFTCSRPRLTHITIGLHPMEAYI